MDALRDASDNDIAKHMPMFVVQLFKIIMSNMTKNIVLIIPLV